jgi:DNA-binding response OmpR family regulator
MTLNPQVLVVEDEPSMQVLLRHILVRAGYDITMATDCYQAQDILARRRFDLICSDVMMSGINGLELCRWFHQQPGAYATPFILLSSRAQEGEREEGLQAGASAYLTKPFDIGELLAIFSELLARPISN